MDLFLTACAPRSLYYQVQSTTRCAGLLKIYRQICLAQGCSARMEPPRSKHSATGRKEAPEGPGGQYSQQSLAHQALVEVPLAIRAVDGLLVGGAGKLAAAKEGPNFHALILKRAEEGSQRRVPSEAIEILRTVHSHFIFGVVCVLWTTMSFSHQGGYHVPCPIPRHRLCQEPLLWLPRQKRQEESSKPIARAIIHEKRNTHLICIQLQIATHCRGGLYIIK